MVIKAQSMRKETRAAMRGGTGTIEILHCAENENLFNSRLFAVMTVPAGGSIGEHDHVNETEYYLLLDGEGVVNDNGSDIKVSAGDLIVTGNGAKHSIRNSGFTELRFIAVIILK